MGDSTDSSGDWLGSLISVAGKFLGGQSRAAAPTVSSAYSMPTSTNSGLFGLNSSGWAQNYGGTQRATSSPGLTVGAATIPRAWIAGAALLLLVIISRR